MTIVINLAATALAVALFGLCVLPVGWLAGRRLDLPGGTASWALLLGVALVPLGYYLLAHGLGAAVAWAGLAAASGVALAGLARGAERQALAETLAGLKDRRLLWGAALWAGAAWLLIADLPFGDRLSLSGVLIDYAKHVSVTDAISRTGIPPVNPSFRPGSDQPLFYYYFWFLLCSLPDQLGGGLVTAKHAVFAGTLWAGLVLVAALRVTADLLPPSRLTPADATAIAAALLLVTGLDLLPFLTIHLHAALAGPVPGPLPDLEWWNEQATAWISAVLWVPHHVGALAVCLAGFRLAERGGVLAVGLAGAAFASALGMSVWVALTAATIGAVWCGVLLLRRDGRGLTSWLGAGGVALLLALPFVLDLSVGRQSARAPMEIAIRAFFPLTRADQFFGMDVTCGPLCNLMALPLSYGLEFGFFGLAAVLYWLRRRQNAAPLGRGELFLLVQAAASLVLCSLVKAQMAVTNDLGWRGLMFVQVALLLWAVPVVAAFAQAGRWRPWLKITAALGLAATAIQTVQLRTLPASQRDADLRRTYEWVAAHTPPDAIVQHDPSALLEGLHALYGNRQVACSDRLYSTLYGIAAETALALRAELEPLFTAPAPPPADVVALARRFGITHLVAKAEDPVWQDRNGWVWVTQPLYATLSTRVVAVADVERLSHR